MLLPKDLLADLETGDRTKEHLEAKEMSQAKIASEWSQMTQTPNWALAQSLGRAQQVVGGRLYQVANIGLQGQMNSFQGGNLSW
jgi:hypothetical protein